MQASSPPPVQVLHLDTPAGALFALHHRPAAEPQHPVAMPRAAIVFVHALAEEMNKSRRMVALQARDLARAGFAVLVPDLHGCGDSAGDFQDARWPRWLADIDLALDWMQREHRAPLWLWGHRAGALLACQAARPNVEGLLLWQPLVDGEQALRPWRRMQKMAGLLSSRPAGAAAGTGVDTGSGLQAAGYAFDAELLQPLQAAALDPPAHAPPTLWIDLHDPGAAAPGDPSTRLHSAAAAAWAQQTPVLSYQSLPGPAFWRSSEIDEVPALISATTRALLAACGDRSGPPHHADDPDRHSRSDSAAAPITTAAPPAAETPSTSAAMTEHGLPLDCQGDQLIAVHSRPVGAPHPLGLVIVVGGPQVRTGSHRQFTRLARLAAHAGHPGLRFDLRGMGDSTGQPRPFTDVDDDIDAAIGGLLAQQPALQGALLWGLCDGATAIALYLQRRRDPRVLGVCLVNPWVRSEQTLAQARLDHYYRRRLLQAEFWRKLLHGGVGLAALKSWREQRQLARAGTTSMAAGAGEATKAAGSGAASTAAGTGEASTAASAGKASTAADMGAASTTARSGTAAAALRAGAPVAATPSAPVSALAEEVFSALHHFSHPVHLVLADADLTAQEFATALRSRYRDAPPWTVHRIPAADHTCSTPLADAALMAASLAALQQALGRP